MAVLRDDIAIKTTCAECGTPLWGVRLHRRDDLFYCSADFERLSPQEALVNDRTQRIFELHQSMFDGSAIEEYVTNGGFDSDVSWTKGTGWAISSGVASCDGTQSAESLLTQVQAKSEGVDEGFITGLDYVYVFTVSNFSAGTVKVRFGTSYAGTARSSNGTFTEELRQHFQYDNNALAADSDFVGSIDNFSVRRRKT